MTKINSNRGSISLTPKKPIVLNRTPRVAPPAAIPASAAPSVALQIEDGSFFPNTTKTANGKNAQNTRRSDMKSPIGLTHRETRRREFADPRGPPLRLFWRGAERSDG